ncbi:MAG TPA: M1 family aminopeptidase [Dermatophilaceae bacterium]|nr:M1 family aminopeptidase [Dermatophilaceae bacterium]
MPALTRDEARARAAALRVDSYDVDLDLDRGPEHFGSVTTLRLTVPEPGTTTFVDLRPVELHAATLDGGLLDPAALADGRLALTGLDAGEHVLVVDATMAYSRDGQGLHRTTDPVVGEAYVFGHSFLDAAPSVLACVDQPDLKAPLRVTVTAPEHWTVLGNGAATREAPGRWRLAETAPVPTYGVTVCAGPWASVTGEHDGIPLGLHARRSLGDHLAAQAPQMLEVTALSFDHYHRLFGIRHPFGHYQQVFVPEFNAGAMENPGCVTFREDVLFRGPATREQLLVRSSTIAHEMAHMWFGDLPTMRWWDDLWLNESFAEYHAYRTLVETGLFPDAWVEFTIARTMWGYAAERAPSTHPVAGAPAPDAAAALENFDGISYAKGAAVLRQLVAHVGEAAFDAGVRSYLAERAHGNGELADFLAAMSAAAERSHTLDVAGFGGGAERWRAEVTTSGPRTALPAAAERSAAGTPVVVPSAGALTWAAVELDGATVAALDEELARVPDPVARSVLWVALLSGVYRGGVDPRRAVLVLEAALPLEPDEAVLTRVAAQVTDRVVPTFLPEPEQAGATGRVAAAARALLERAERDGASTGAVVAARLLARTSEDHAELRSWLRGDGVPAALAGDADFRWLVVRTLAAAGELGPGEVDAMRAEDDTVAGRLAALTARAAVPTAAAKAEAWRLLTAGPGLSNHEAVAVAEGFWLTPDRDLVRPYVARYADAVAAMGGWLGADALARVAGTAYPSRLVEAATAEASRAALVRTDLPVVVHRVVLDADSRLHEALRSLERFG